MEKRKSAAVFALNLWKAVPPWTLVSSHTPPLQYPAPVIPPSPDFAVTTVKLQAMHWFTYWGMSWVVKTQSQKKLLIPPYRITTAIWSMLIIPYIAIWWIQVLGATHCRLLLNLSPSLASVMKSKCQPAKVSNTAPTPPPSSRNKAQFHREGCQQRWKSWYFTKLTEEKYF